MNIKNKIGKKLNRFINNDEKDKAIIYLNQTLQEMVEQGASTEQEVDQVIADFVKHSSMKLKFYHRRVFQALGLVVLLFGTLIFAMWNPMWKLSDQSAYLKDNGFQKEGATYNKIATKELTLTYEIIANNTVFANYSTGDVVEITYEFNMNLEGLEGHIIHVIIIPTLMSNH